MTSRSRSPGWEEMKAEARPGHCALCDEPLPPRIGWRGRPRFICAAVDCRRTYQAIIKADYYVQRKAQRKAEAAHG